MRKDPKNFRERFKHWKETGEYLLPGSTLPDTSSVESSLPGYDGGKDGFTKTYVNQWGVDEEGNVRTPSGDIQNAVVVLDDIYVTPKGNYLTPPKKKDYFYTANSAYHPEDVADFFNLTGAGLIFNPFRLSQNSINLLDNPNKENAVAVANDALPWSKWGRLALGTYNLLNEDGVRKTYNRFNNGEYGAGTMSLLGDALNLAMAGEGSTALKPIINIGGSVIKNKGFAIVNPYGNSLRWIGSGNNSQISLDFAGDGWIKPAYINSTRKGTGIKLYNAAILFSLQLGYKGIKSGEFLQSAPKTYSTWKHYPERQLLGNYGTHTNYNMRVDHSNHIISNTPEELNRLTIQGIESELYNAPVYGLTRPTSNVYIFNPKNRGLNNIITNITSSNAKKVTDSMWDAAYNAALKSGDMAEAQRLRDLHFMVKSNSTVAENGLPIRTYHTVNESYPADFTEFNPNIEGTHSAIYTSRSPIMSGTYTNRLVSEAEREAYIKAGIENIERGIKEGWIKGEELQKAKEALKIPESAREYVINKMPQLRQAISPERQKTLYVRLNRPLRIEGGGKHWNNIPISDLPEDVYRELRSSQMNGYTTRDIERAQMTTENYDGAIINNITDYGSSWKSTMRQMEPSVVYQVNSPNSLKLANAITYDDVGNIIPLSQRDNFNIKDFRYAMAPILFGSGIGSYYLNNK